MENSPTPRFRRRLIQTTLFPRKPPVNVVCVDDDIEIIDLEQGEGDDDECVGGSQSQFANSKKRKMEAASAQQASKKVAANGNEARGKDIEEVSPSTAKADFFAKVSERRQQQRQEKEPPSVQSPENIEQSCSPSSIIAFVLLRMAAFAQSHGGEGSSRPSGRIASGGQGSTRKNTRGPTTNIELKKAVERRGPLPIKFDIKDQKTYLHVGENAAWFGNLLGEIVREFPFYYPSWRDIPQEDRVNVYEKIKAHFLIDNHLAGPHGHKIKKGIEDSLCKLYNHNKHSYKVEHWVEKGGIAAVEEIRSNPPENVSAERWSKQVDFWADPKRAHRAEVNARNSRCQIPSFHGSRSLAVTRHEYFSIHGVYPSLIKNYFDNHTRDNVFVHPQAEKNYNEMLRLRAQGEGTSTGIAMTDAEIVSQVLGGKQRGHLPGRGRIVSGVDLSSCFGSQSQCPPSYSQQEVGSQSQGPPSYSEQEAGPQSQGPSSDSQQEVRSQSQGPRSYTQQEVDELLRQQAERQHNETMEARRAAERTQTQLNQMVAFLSSQPGLSGLSSMFPPPSRNDGNNDDDNGDGA